MTSIPAATDARAAAMCAAERSIPTTLPSCAAASASQCNASPVPQPASSTCVPGSTFKLAIAARSSRAAKTLNSLSLRE